MLSERIALPSPVENGDQYSRKGHQQDLRLTGLPLVSESVRLFFRRRLNFIRMKPWFLYEYHRLIIPFAAAVKDKRHQTGADYHRKNNAQCHSDVTGGWNAGIGAGPAEIADETGCDKEC